MVVIDVERKSRSNLAIDDLPNKGHVTHIACCPDGVHVAVAIVTEHKYAGRGQLWILNRQTMAEGFQVRHEGTVSDLAWSPRDDLMAISTYQGVTTIVKGSQGQFVHALHVGSSAGPSLPNDTTSANSHPSLVRWSRDGAMIGTSQPDIATPTLWSAGDWEVLAHISGSNNISFAATTPVFAASVIVGPHALGPWHEEEYRTLTQRRIERRTDGRRRLRVIPVLLDGVVELPPFLRGIVHVDLRPGPERTDHEEFKRLVQAILSVRAPERTDAS